MTRGDNDDTPDRFLGLWILDDQHRPVRCGIKTYCEWHDDPERRRVAFTDVSTNPPVHVSTVFLSIGHSLFFGGRKPELFETMVFGGVMDQCQWRYSTWEEAEAGHAEIVRLVRLSLVRAVNDTVKGGGGK